MKITKIAFFLFLTLSLLACSAIKSNEETSGFIVRLATMKVIENHDIDPNRVIEISARAIRAIESDTETTINDLTRGIVKSINWDSLDITERTAVNGLIALLQNEIRSHLKDNPGMSENLVYAKTVLKWVHDAALISANQ